jgi:hypothetical protein
MNQADFVALVEVLLSTARVEYERRQLLSFVASAWPLIEDEPDAVRWAREFLVSHPTAVMCG